MPDHHIYIYIHTLKKEDFKFNRSSHLSIGDNIIYSIFYMINNSSHPCVFLLFQTQYSIEKYQKVNSREYLDLRIFRRVKFSEVRLRAQIFSQLG